MMKFEAKLTGTQLAAKRTNATSIALRNLFFSQIENETELMWKTARRNAWEIPEAPTGRLRDSIRMGFEERGNQLVGRVLPDQRIAPYAEWVEYGHNVVRNGNVVGFVQGLHYFELAYLEVRRESKRRIEKGMANRLRWYDSPGAVHRKTGKQLSILP
jgi:hypothetical protein